MASYKDLSFATMVHITAAWVDPKAVRPLLEKTKRVAPLMEDVESAHAGLVKAHHKENAAEGAIAAIQTEQLALDQIHDRKARGAFHVLSGLIDIADSLEEAAPYQTALETLFPDGLRIITATYSDEAGRTKLTRERITPAVKATLKGISSPDGTLLKTVTRWLDAGDALGALEEKRAKLEAASARHYETSGRAELLRARNRWIGVVRAVIDMIDLEGLEGAARDEILGPLERAVSQSARRRKESKTSPAPAPGETSQETAPVSPAPPA